ncbi:MAG: hypothetical protein R2695_17770 [Acidimicrobiales bacterium]
MTAADQLTVIALKHAGTAGHGAWLGSIGDVVARVGGSLWRLHAVPVRRAGPATPTSRSFPARKRPPATTPPYGGAAATGRSRWGTPRSGDLWCGTARPGWSAKHRHRWRSSSPRCCAPTPSATTSGTWYDAQHLPDMLACGAFSTGSRWRREPRRPGGANDLTLYEIAEGSVEAAITRSAEAVPAIVAAGRKHECHTGGLTLAVSLEAPNLPNW